MSHVFISYSRRGSEAVDQIVTRLEAENFTVWIDREDIHGGDLWREAIVEAVDNAYAFVLMLSPASGASDNVRKEVDLAEGAGDADFNAGAAREVGVGSGHAPVVAAAGSFLGAGEG